MSRIAATLLALIPLFLAGCGGGGGGGGNDGNPAKAEVEVKPKRIDSGDRTKLTLKLREVDPEKVLGLYIKLLYPSGLAYVADTAVLDRENEDDVELFVVTSAADEATYLLIYITTSSFQNSNGKGTITLVLEGTGEVENGSIAVDVDSADADPRAGFNPNNPQFTPIVETSINVLS